MNAIFENDPSKAIENKMWLLRARRKHQTIEQKIELEFAKCKEMVEERRQANAVTTRYIEKFEKTMDSLIAENQDNDTLRPFREAVIKLNEDMTELEKSQQELKGKLGVNENELSNWSIRKQDLIMRLNQLTESLHSSKNKYYQGEREILQLGEYYSTIMSKGNK